MSLFKRNLTKYGKPITLQNRDIVAPEYGSVDFDENFSGDVEVNAIIKTVRGKTFFDGVATERPITHVIRIEYVEGQIDDDTVTAETWVLFKNKRIDILAVENCCENDEVLVLTCSNLGSGEVAKA